MNNGEKPAVAHKKKYPLTRVTMPGGHRSMICLANSAPSGKSTEMNYVKTVSAEEFQKMQGGISAAKNEVPRPKVQVEKAPVSPSKTSATTFSRKQPPPNPAANYASDKKTKKPEEWTVVTKRRPRK